MKSVEEVAFEGKGGVIALQPEPGFSHSVRKYYRIFRASLIERMVYRADFFINTILRFLPMLTTILLWSAVFAGVDDSPEGKELRGFTYHQMIAYLLLVHISRMFSSMPGLANSIAHDIRDGSLKKYLLQPLDLIGYLLSYRLAHKAAYITMSSLPYAGLFLACLHFFDGYPDGVTLAAYVASLFLGFLIGFFFEATLGMVGFWFLEVSSLLWVVNTLNFFVSGQMFPLDLLGEPWATILKTLPFQFMAYFPAAVFLGKVEGMALVQGLLLALFWAVAFFVMARVLYRIGLRRYSAFGG
jgi:ABC-2 type transport system permease protein